MGNDPTPAPRLLAPRRLLNASVLFAVLCLAGVGAAGLGTPPVVASSPLPASLSLPDVHVGDRGTYTWDRVVLGSDGTAQVLESHDAVAFEWLGPADMRDRDGRLHATNPLRVSANFDNRGDWQASPYQDVVLSLDTSTRQAVAVTSQDSSHAISQGDIRDSSGLRRDYFAASDPTTTAAPRCGLVSPFFGTQVPLSGSVHLLGRCLARRAGDYPVDLAFTPMGTQVLEGRPTVLFTHEGKAPRDASDRWDLGIPTVHVWLDPAYPVPVRIAIQFLAPEPDGMAGGFDVYRLSSFGRGTTPLAWDRQAKDDVAPAWTVAPLVDGLPDEAGIEHPFSAHTALRAARGNSNATAFFKVLDGGFLRWAYLLDWHERHDGGFYDRSISWGFMACDGKESRGIFVTRYNRTDAADAIPPIVLPPQPAQPTHEDYVIVSEEEHYHEPCDLHESDLPSSAPTVASMMSRWRAFASPQAARLSGNSWDFDRASHRITAGHAAAHDWTNRTDRVPFVLSDVVESTLTQESLLTAWFDGSDRATSRPVDHLEESRRFDLSAPAPGPLPATRPAAAAAPLRAAEVAVSHDATWVPPSGYVAAASGLVALAAAVAYLLWPALKSGGLAGLFSRVRSPYEEQAHPVRRALLDLVAAQPGMHVRELQRRLGLGRHQVDHHVRRLVAVGALRAVTRDGYSCLFLRGAEDAAAMQAAPALKAEAARRILAAAVAMPGIGARELARQAGLSPGTVSHHLRRMRHAGLIGMADGAAGIVVTDLGRRAAAV